MSNLHSLSEEDDRKIKASMEAFNQTLLHQQQTQQQQAHQAQQQQMQTLPFLSYSNDTGNNGIGTFAPSYIDGIPVVFDEKLDLLKLENYLLSPKNPNINRHSNSSSRGNSNYNNASTHAQHEDHKSIHEQKQLMDALFFQRKSSMEDFTLDFAVAAAEAEARASAADSTAVTASALLPSSDEENFLYSPSTHVTTNSISESSSGFSPRESGSEASPLPPPLSDNLFSSFENGDGSLDMLPATLFSYEKGNNTKGKQQLSSVVPKVQYSPLDFNVKSSSNSEDKVIGTYHNSNNNNNNNNNNTPILQQATLASTLASQCYPSSSSSSSFLLPANSSCSTNGNGNNGPRVKRLATTAAMRHDKSPLEWEDNTYEPVFAVYDSNMQKVDCSSFAVFADKGFAYSPLDDAFICQKKNHFQLTLTAAIPAEIRYIETPQGLQQVGEFHVHVFGIRAENRNDHIDIEQSSSDRCKQPYVPVNIGVPANFGSNFKATVNRLHFTETTANNMRRKGKPNPDQRFFSVVVAIRASVIGGNNQQYSIVSRRSEDIIVRSSNPSQFENEPEPGWHKGLKSESAQVHFGTVGINTEAPDEALVVHGNVKVTGAVLQPSDRRVKENILPRDSAQQLANIRSLGVYNYELTPEWAEHTGRPSDQRSDAGVLAQEVASVLPDAVIATPGSVHLENGTRIDNLLVVNKERIFMENIGATQELAKKSDKLEQRVDRIEETLEMHELNLKDDGNHFEEGQSNQQLSGNGVNDSLSRYSRRRRFLCLFAIFFGCIFIALSVTIAVRVTNGAGTSPHENQHNSAQLSLVSRRNDTVSGYEDVMILLAGQEFQEPGFSAFDIRDGDITANVVVEGKVDTMVLGDQVLVYTVFNSKGLRTQVKRMVRIIEGTCPMGCENGLCLHAGVCDCSSGWAGTSCNQFTCVSKPCRNGGTCVAPNLCGCPSGWQGSDCSVATFSNFLLKYLIVKSPIESEAIVPSLPSSESEGNLIFDPTLSEYVISIRSNSGASLLSEIEFELTPAFQGSLHAPAHKTVLCYATKCSCQQSSSIINPDDLDLEKENKDTKYSARIRISEGAVRFAIRVVPAIGGSCNSSEGRSTFITITSECPNMTFCNPPPFF